MSENFRALSGGWITARRSSRVRAWPTSPRKTSGASSSWTPARKSSRIRIALCESLSGNTHFKATLESRTSLIPGRGPRGRVQRRGRSHQSSLGAPRASGPCALTCVSNILLVTDATGGPMGPLPHLGQELFGDYLHYRVCRHWVWSSKSIPGSSCPRRTDRRHRPRASTRCPSQVRLAVARRS